MSPSATMDLSVTAPEPSSVMTTDVLIRALMAESENTIANEPSVLVVRCNITGAIRVIVNKLEVSRENTLGQG
ncbi:MAG: hypothetical protein VB996_11625 [Pseudomonadales bacterium]